MTKRSTTTRALDRHSSEIVDRTASTRLPPIEPTPLDDLPTVRPDRPLVAVRPDILDPLSVRDAPAPPPGYRYTLDGRLVPILESRADLTDPSAQEAAYEILERTGSLRAVADALGLRPHELKSYLSKDMEFAERMEEAADRHREAIYASAYRRAVEGYDVPIVGGKDKDEIVAYERRYSDSLTKLLLQRHYPEFRSTTSFTVNKIGTQNNVALDPRTLPAADREHLRRILKAPPEVIDAESTDDVPDVPRSPIEGADQ